MVEFCAKGRNNCESVYENERLVAQINRYRLIESISEGARYRHVSGGTDRSLLTFIE
jgi:hypothetical protein